MEEHQLAGYSDRFVQRPWVQSAHFVAHGSKLTHLMGVLCALVCFFARKKKSEAGSSSRSFDIP